MVRRILRFLFSLLFALAALGLTVAVVLHFNRGWQRDLTDAALEARTGLQWSLGEAAFTELNRWQASEVFVLQGTEGVQAAEVDLRFDWGRTLGTDEWVVTGGSVRGLYIDLASVPPEAFGLSAAQLAGATPTREQTLAAVQLFAETAVARLAAAGFPFEANDLRVGGEVQLPGGRRLAFETTVVHAVSDNPHALNLDIHAAEFR